MKINKKFLIILVLAVVGVGFAWSVFVPKKVVYKTEKVVRGDIVAEIAETGVVKKGEPVKLNFKSGGTIADVAVVVGQTVLLGDVLAKLDDHQLQIQLTQARANLDLFNLQLEKLENGATIEDVGIVQSEQQAAKTGQNGAEQFLADARTGAKQKLESVYKVATDALSEASIKAYNSYNFADLLQRTYFIPRDNDSILVWETVQKVGVAVADIGKFVVVAQANGKNDGLDVVFEQSKKRMSDIEGELRIIRSMCEKLPWRDSVVIADKENLDLHIGYVVLAQSALNSAIENVELQKSINNSAINSAQAGVDVARAGLKTANEQLNKIATAPRVEDVGVLKSQIAQAQSQVNLLELQISDSRLIAAVAGQVIEVNGRVGEAVSPLSASGLIVLLPTDPYTIEADIYEEDVIKEKIGDLVKISLAAIPDNNFVGHVISIDPTGKLVNGVVYYSTKIAFNDFVQGLKPEMTADVVIKTASKENVLLVSESAIQKKQDGGYFVKILKNGLPQEQKVGIGIRSKGMVEIISGVSESDEIIIS